MSTPSLVSKFPQMGTNIFSQMNTVCVEHDAINLAQGFPNFPCSERLVGLVSDAMNRGRNQYAPMPGTPELREAISEKIEHIYGVSYDPETQVNVTPGGHAALAAAIAATVHPGDEVIIFEPAFDCFAPLIELSGGVPVYVSLTPPDYGVCWDEVRNLVSDKTRMIFINTPHNPTGTVFDENDMQNLSDIVRDTNIVVLSDEVYEHIIFDGLEHQSVIRYPELVERSFAVFSFGKVYHVTGWKIGYCVAPKELMTEFRKCFQMMSFTTNTPMQLGIAEFLKDRAGYLELPAFYQQKRDFFLERIKDSKFSFTPARGTYFQALTYENITNDGDMEAAVKFTRELKVGSVPMSAFYHDKAEHNVLRFCFAKTEETLEQAAEKLCQI